ncbi:hypothetical protein BX600DRAFT_508547 [Xylariales sp. PMI_506]|nr:hypothetical protein BX600DRAFT_508547 [Xylariales sp. PMI_506]
MRISAVLLATTVSNANFVNAESSEDAALEATLTAFPSCAITCLELELPQSTCSPTNVTCVCTNEALQAEITLCLSTACTTYDALAAQNASYTMCGQSVRDERSVQVRVAVIGCSVTLFVYMLRIVAKLRTLSRRLNGEDYIITAAMAVTILTSVSHAISGYLARHNLNTVALTCGSHVAASYGVGKDIWTLSPENIQEALKWFLITELGYFVGIGLVKLSLLTVTLRIIPDKKFQRLVFATMGLVVAYTITFFVGTLFQCQPISYIWMQLNEHWQGHCNNINIQAESSVALNILLDIIIMILPLKHLWNLQLDIWKKMTVMAMFLLGVFVTIISCIRLQAFIAFASSANVTWDDRSGADWSLAELFAGVICACLPALRPLLVVLRVKYASTQSLNNGYASQSSRLQPSVPLVDLEKQASESSRVARKNERQPRVMSVSKVTTTTVVVDDNPSIAKSDGDYINYARNW